MAGRNAHLRRLLRTSELHTRLLTHEKRVYDCFLSLVKLSLFGQISPQRHTDFLFSASTHSQKRESRRRGHRLPSVSQRELHTQTKLGSIFEFPFFDIRRRQGDEDGGTSKRPVDGKAIDRQSPRRTEKDWTALYNKTTKGGKERPEFWDQKS